jgi:hypothetical protein
MGSPDPEHRRFLRDLGLLLGLPFLAMAALVAWWRPWDRSVFQLPAGTDIHAFATGTWDWEGAEDFCVKNPHTISFSPDRKVMTLRFRTSWTDSTGASHQIAEYDLEDAEPGTLRGRIRGETRMTAGGEPVVWDLVPTSPRSYSWHRTDWPSWGRTPNVRRCPTRSGGAR